MNRRNRLALLWGIAVFTFTLDQLTKDLAVRFLKRAPNIELFDGIVKLTYLENSGSWGGYGRLWSEDEKFIWLFLVPLIGLLYTAVYGILTDKIYSLNAIGYTLLISGGMGNLFDRFHQGYAVDFMWVGIGPLRTNVFNIADVAITIAIPLIISGLFKKEIS